MATPSERYRASDRPYPESLPAIEYGLGDIVRKADKEGDISFKGRRLRVGKPFRGEPIAMHPTPQDGVFSIHFCTHQIGTVDLREPAACGLVDIALPADRCGQTSDAMPTSPQAQQQQQMVD